MSSFLWCLEELSKLNEFTSTEDNFTHIEPNSELSFSNIATSKFIEVPEKFSNSDSLFLALLSELSKDIFDVVWDVLLDIDTSNPWSVLWIVVEGVIVSSSDTEELFR